MAFILFLLVNAALFIRPAEIVPALLGWEIYFYLIVACALVAIPDVLQYLTGQSLDKQPITLCVFGLALLIPLPFVLAGDMSEAWRTGFHFAKVVVYYLLFVSIVTTPTQLRYFLVSILIFSGIVTLLAVLRFHDVIQLNTMEALKDSMIGEHGESVAIRRLQGTGIFQDPNELCVLLSALLPLGLYFILTDRNLFLRIACVPMVPIFAYAVYLTQSRGGFIAFTGGLGVLVWMRYGWKKAAIIGAVGLPLLLILFAGRQTEISTSTGTARSRVELWRDWLATFKENIVVGNGMPLPKDEDAKKKRRSDEAMQHLAHNSYLQGFADMGVIGGLLLVGAFFTALWSIYRYNGQDSVVINNDLRTMQPYLFAGIGAFALGMMTLSICYMVPTYMMLAMSVAYTRMARRAVLVSPPPLQFDVALLTRFAAVGFCTLGSIYVFVKIFA